MKKLLTAIFTQLQYYFAIKSQSAILDQPRLLYKLKAIQFNMVYNRSELLGQAKFNNKSRPRESRKTWREL